MHTRRIAIALLTATSLLAACGGADETEISRAREYVKKLCEHESGDGGAFDGMTLVKASKPFEPVPAGIMIAVGTNGVSVDGRPTVTAAELAGETRVSAKLHDALLEERRREQMIAARDSRHQNKRLVLAFDSSAPAQSVRVVLETLFQAEYRQVLLAFEPGVAPQLPPAPDRVLDDELRRLPADQLPLHGANKMAELAADCPDLAELFNALALVPPEQRCSMIADSLGEVFGSSSCRADIDKVLTLVRAMTVPRKPLTVHRVALHPDAPGIPTSPTDTWARIAVALFERGGDRLWLELAPAAPTPAQ